MDALCSRLGCDEDADFACEAGSCGVALCAKHAHLEIRLEDSQEIFRCSDCCDGRCDDGACAPYTPEG